MALTRDHIICGDGELVKIIPKLSLINPFMYSSVIVYVISMYKQQKNWKAVEHT